MRRQLRDGDAAAIVALHERLYVAEYGVDERFVEGVSASVKSALARGWPAGGGVWLVDGDAGLSGCLALTDEGKGLAKIRWVLLSPELRGRGLGRRMAAEAVTEAQDLGFGRVELHTFAALRRAGAIYRSLGFVVESEEETEMWGPPITFQHYVLELAPLRD